MGGVPMAPTIFVPKRLYCGANFRSPRALLQEIQARGWEHFVMKQSYGFGSAGFKKLSVKECQDEPKILEEYFDEHSECPEYVVQEFIEGFCRNWEVRCFWFNGDFLYAIANRAAVSQSEGEKVGIITEDEIPSEFLENVKRIGKQALEALPPLMTPDGQPIGMTLIRTDIGCADSKVCDKDTHWDPDAKTFFLNEIEYGGTTYFPRVLKFDAIPMYADLYASKALEIHQKTFGRQQGMVCSIVDNHFLTKLDGNVHANIKKGPESEGCFNFLKEILGKFSAFFNNAKLVQEPDAELASSEEPSASEVLAAVTALSKRFDQLATKEDLKDLER